MAYTDLEIKDGVGTIRAFVSDVISGKYFQRVKMQWGAQGTVTEVANATPMPVTPRDSSGVELAAPELSPEDSVYFLPAVSLVSTGHKIDFGAASAAGAVITGTLVVLTATQPCFIRQAVSPAALVDTDTYLPANVSRPFRITSGNRIAAIAPTGGTPGTLYVSVIG